MRMMDKNKALRGVCDLKVSHFLVLLNPISLGFADVLLPHAGSQQADPLSFLLLVSLGLYTSPKTPTVEFRSCPNNKLSPLI